MKRKFLVLLTGLAVCLLLAGADNLEVTSSIVTADWVTEAGGINSFDRMLQRPGPAPTQDKNKLMPVPVDALVLMNGTIIDGVGTTPLPNGLVVIQEERILAVGRATDFMIPAEAKVINVAGETIMPGLINAHVHNTYSAVTRRRFLVEGVTSVCDLGSSLNHISLFEQVNTGQNQPAARGFRTGPIITITGGYPSTIYGFSWDYQVATPDEARAAVANLLNQGADVIKIALEPGHPKRPWSVLSREQVQVIVATAHAQNALVRAHVRQAAMLDIALAAGVDVIEHVPVPFCLEVELKPMLEQDALHLAALPAFEVQLMRMAEQEVILIPTLAVTENVIEMLPGLEPHERQAALGFFLESVRYFRQLGGTVAVGNDYGNIGVQPGLPQREMELLLAAGLTPLEIIEAGTRQAARVCGHGDELGALEPGKLADVIVVAGDPLADLAALNKVMMVIKGGQIAYVWEQK